MSELYREIEEDIRRERWERLWLRYGRTALWASVAVVLGTAAGVLWGQHRTSQVAALTAQFLAAAESLQAQDYPKTIESLSAIEAARAPFSGLARLQRAAAEKSAGKQEEAQKTYEALAASGDDFAGLARMMAGGAPPQDALRLFYYTQNEWKAWRLSAEGKKSEAKVAFMALAEDEGAPLTLRSRARLALSQMDAP